MNQLNAVCLVFQEQEGAKSKFLGSCFAYRKRNCFFTAAHVVNDVEVTQLSVLSPNEGVFSRVQEVHLHPSSDVAILILANSGRETIEPFMMIDSSGAVGQEFFAFGFPEDYIGPNQGHPIPRMFRGYFQRFMPHQSHMGYKYDAGELSTPCPGGLSGGPVFSTHPLNSLINSVWGIVTENIETSTVLHEQEVVSTEGGLVREHYRRVINYGVAVKLYDIQDWLNEHVR